MKNKKYNTSLSTLYEGLERLDTIYHQRAGGRRCNISVPDNVRQFLFSVGEYANKDENNRDVPAHTSVAGFLSNNVPLSIFRYIEKAVANRENFDLIMSGPVADFSKLFLSEIDCGLIQLGLDKLSVFLTTTSKFKGDVKVSQDRIAASEAALVGAAAATDQETVYNSTISLASEETELLNKIVRRQRIDSLKFRDTFRPLNSSSSTGIVDQKVFFFENFFKEYYDSQNWDVNKLREDIDLIEDMARGTRSISDRGTLVDIYRNFMTAVGAKSNRSTIEKLKGLEPTADKEAKKYFKKKLGLMIFLDSYPESCFFGMAYYHLSKNQTIQRQLSNDIKSLIRDYANKIQSIFL